MLNIPTRPTTDIRPLERGRELPRIDGLLSAAMTGDGQVEVIEAPSGIGKSTLLAEARNRALAAGLQVIHTAGSELEVDYPFGTVLNLFQERVTLADATERGRLLRGPAASSAPLLSDCDEPWSTWEARDEFALLRGLYWCTVNISEIQPMAILVDDLHWADEMSLRFFSYLAKRIDDLPVVLILAIRTGERRADRPLVAHLTAVEDEHVMGLTALTAPAVEELLRRGISELTSPELVRTCWTITGGNPFLLTELITTIRAEGPEWLAANLHRLESSAPAGMRRRILLRLTRLGTNALGLARACSVLGGSATLRSASLLAGISVEAAASAADHLFSADILAPGAQLAFKHPIMRPAVYEDLPPAQRRLTHTAAAGLLRDAGERPDLIAHHLWLGVDVAEPWAIDILQLAATSAARKGSPATAARYLRRAIGPGLTEERRVPILVDLGMFEAACGEAEAAVDRLEDAVRLMSDPVEQARCLHSLGSTLYRYGRHSEAATAFQRSAELGRPFDEELALAAEGGWIFTAYYLDSVLPQALTRLEQLSQQALARDTTTAAERVILAVAALRSSMANPPAVQGGRLAVEALKDGALLREQTSASVAVNLANLALIYSGRLDEAASTVDDVMANARSEGNVLAVAESCLIRSFVHLAQGEVTNAWIDAQAAVDGIDQGWYGLAPLARGTLAQCHIQRNELEQAAALVGGADHPSSSEQTQGMYSWISMARGQLAMARSEPQAALEHFLATGRALGAFGTTNPAVLRWRSMAGLAAKALGEVDLAIDLIAEELELARRFGLAAEIGAALRCKAALTSGQAQIDLLEASLRELESSGHTLDLAETLCDLGGALRRAGRRVDSRVPLSRAMDLAHRVGALAVADRARDELLSSGSRPRRLSLSGLESLTPTERRIADSAATGMSNRDIAESLFLARSTVAWHLRHVFSKLEVTSRAELTERFSGDGSGPVRQARVAAPHSRALLTTS